MSQLGTEKDQEINQLQQRIEELQHHIENLCQQHEEILLRAENDKQQSLLIGWIFQHTNTQHHDNMKYEFTWNYISAHQDQQVLIEKLENVYRELEGEKGTLDRVRREAATHAEQDRNNLNKTRDELNRMKTKLDESKLKADEEKLKLELKMEEIRNEKENAMKECEELQVQLHMSDDKVDELQNQLQDTCRKLKEGK